MIAVTLHQIEVSSQCSLRCQYCLWPTMTRSKQHMTTHTWMQCLRWLQHFVDAGTQGELVLSGTGEPTLNPRLPQMALEARQILGPKRRLMTTTNGLHMTEELAAALVPSGMRVYVSMHRPEKAKPAMELLQRVGLFEQAVMDPVVGSNSWAGQVDWYDSINAGGDKRPVCPWLSRGWLFVASTGQCFSCCYANGDTPVIGHVDEPCHGVTPQPWRVCDACWQRPPKFNEISPELSR